MKNKKLIAIVTFLLLFAVPFTLLAQQIDNQISATKYKAGDIIGAPIIPPGTNLANFQVGTVNDLIIDSQGRVIQIVADLRTNIIGSFWSGAGLYLMPSNTFSPSAINNNKLALVINQVPTSNIPHANSSENIPGMIPANTVQVTNFKQFKVVDTNNESLGNVGDVVIDLAQDTVTYVAVEESNTAKGGNNFYAIPFTEIKFDVANKQITLDMTKQQLESRPAFGPNNWPENPTP